MRVRTRLAGIVAATGVAALATGGSSATRIEGTAFDFLLMQPGQSAPAPAGREAFDDANWHKDTVGNVAGDTCITVDRSGRFLVGGKVQWELQEDGARVIWVTKRNLLAQTPRVVVVDTLAVVPSLTFVTFQSLDLSLIPLEAGDCVELFVQQTSSKPIFVKIISFWLVEQ